MDKKQAMELIKKVCAIYRGTLDEHKAIQTAIQTIEKEVFNGDPSK